MHFPTLAVGASLALLGLASAQVIVTITNTVTVVTVTETPPPTYTSTILTTVTGAAPTTASTSTKTVTVTAGQPPGGWPPSSPSATAASCPIAQWGQCGGEGYRGSCTSCGSNSVCKYKDVWYSYCSDLPKVVQEIATVYVN